MLVIKQPENTLMKLSPILTTTIIFCSTTYAGEGPQVKISDVPEGYKLVKKDAECVEPDPCAKEKAEVDRLKKELDKLKKANEELKRALAESEEPEECPAPKTIVKTKEVPIDRIIERPVEKIITKTVAADRSVSIGGMVAYSQDGISTSSNESDEYAEDAATYRSVIGGPYITIPIGDRFEAGAFGMFGGVNQTFGFKLGFNFK